MNADCIFCKIIAGDIPSNKVYEDDRVLAFLDISPFEKGHTLVIPKTHAPFLTDLPDADLADAIITAKRIGQSLLKNLPCDGFNIVQNNGACASQVVHHVHFHVIPRWNGTPIRWEKTAYDSPDEIAQTLQRIKL